MKPILPEFILLDYINNTNDVEFIAIKRPEVEPMFYYNNYIRYYDDKELANIIYYKMRDLNCCKLYKEKMYLIPIEPKYIVMIQTIFYYMLKLKNQLTYNHILDTLCTMHSLNMNFYYDYLNTQNTQNTTKIKNKPKRIRKVKTNDLFTGEEQNLLIDDRTGKIVKQRKKKVASISFDAMTFSFKRN